MGLLLVVVGGSCWWWVEAVGGVWGRVMLRSVITLLLYAAVFRFADFLKVMRSVDGLGEAVDLRSVPDGSCQSPSSEEPAVVPQGG